jgi:hypothetical protein
VVQLHCGHDPWPRGQRRDPCVAWMRSARPRALGNASSGQASIAYDLCGRPHNMARALANLAPPAVPMRVPFPLCNPARSHPIVIYLALTLACPVCIFCPDVSHFIITCQTSPLVNKRAMCTRIKHCHCVPSLPACPRASNETAKSLAPPVTPPALGALCSASLRPRHRPTAAFSLV